MQPPLAHRPHVDKQPPKQTPQNIFFLHDPRLAPFAAACGSSCLHLLLTTLHRCNVNRSLNQPAPLACPQRSALPAGCCAIPCLPASHLGSSGAFPSNHVRWGWVTSHYAAAAINGTSPPITLRARPHARCHHYSSRGGGMTQAAALKRVLTEDEDKLAPRRAPPVSRAWRQGRQKGVMAAERPIWGGRLRLAGWQAGSNAPALTLPSPRCLCLCLCAGHVPHVRRPKGQPLPAELRPAQHLDLPRVLRPGSLLGEEGPVSGLQRLACRRCALPACMLQHTAPAPRCHALPFRTAARSPSASLLTSTSLLTAMCSPFLLCAAPPCYALHTPALSPHDSTALRCYVVLLFLCNPCKPAQAAAGLRCCCNCEEPTQMVPQEVQPAMAPLGYGCRCWRRRQRRPG